MADEKGRTWQGHRAGQGRAGRKAMGQGMAGIGQGRNGLGEE